MQNQFYNFLHVNEKQKTIILFKLICWTIKKYVINRNLKVRWLRTTVLRYHEKRSWQFCWFKHEVAFFPINVWRVNKGCTHFHFSLFSMPDQQKYYRAFHRFGQAKIADDSLVSGLSRLSLLPSCLKKWRLIWK